ncbi:hypothetical protein V6N13_045364 [Hibiscus sabdariffa]|uniref:Uncharacterized protein n=1 Tax=Hibiscus sabdariffa TaxID=183260 RepID=A0ABR2RKW0_9ROSI
MPTPYSKKLARLHPTRQHAKPYVHSYIILLCFIAPTGSYRWGVGPAGSPLQNGAIQGGGTRCHDTRFLIQRLSMVGLGFRALWFVAVCAFGFCKETKSDGVKLRQTRPASSSLDVSTLNFSALLTTMIA